MMLMLVLMLPLFVFATSLLGFFSGGVCNWLITKIPVFHILRCIHAEDGTLNTRLRHFSHCTPLQYQEINHWRSSQSDLSRTL